MMSVTIGEVVREHAIAKIGPPPKASFPRNMADGGECNPWIWARTVASPGDPRRRAHMCH